MSRSANDILDQIEGLLGELKVRLSEAKQHGPNVITCNCDYTTTQEELGEKCRCCGAEAGVPCSKI